MNDAEELVRMKFEGLAPHLNERAQRIWAGVEAEALGWGGIAIVQRATGMSRTTIRRGRDEFLSGASLQDLGSVRAPGAGRPRIEEAQPELLVALESLVEPVTRGDPESPLRWTTTSTRKLAAALENKGFQVSQQKVGQLLHDLDYSLCATRKTVEGKQSPDRNAQFEHINTRVDAYQKRSAPVVSVDTKKKELVGNFKNGGQEWQPKGHPVGVLVHDFPDDAVGKAIPYGVYDLTDNEAWVNVGIDHDTAEFAVASIGRWWTYMGQKSYPDATELLITADAGGSNGYRTRLWKAELQLLADRTGLTIGVSHFPPGTSKWNKIEHCLFCHITENWRGRPLLDHETVVKLIGSVRTSKGLKVKARIDKRQYPTGIRVDNDEMDGLLITRETFHGDWNYTIHPRADSC